MPTKKQKIELTCPVNRFDKFDSQYGFISGEEWCEKELKRIKKYNDTVDIVYTDTEAWLTVVVTFRDKEIVSQ